VEEDVVEAEGWGMGRGLCPLLEFSILDLKMASFGALWVPVGECIPLILPWIRHCTRVTVC